MLTCAIIGDSIALGLASYFDKGCYVSAKIGIPSASIISRVKDADVVVVSAGSNDPLNPKLADNLKAIRKKITGKVIWIMPVHPVARQKVMLALQPGDLMLSFAPALDKVHPTAASEKDMAREIKEELRK